MNAKIILAVVAAVCCVQGIAAASLIRPLPFVEEDAVEDVAETDLFGMDVDEVIAHVQMMVDQLEEETGMDLGVDMDSFKQARAGRNIFTCGTSLVNLYKTAKDVKALLDEFKANKEDLKDAKEACRNVTQPDLPGPVTNDCLKDAQKAYEQADKNTKNKMVPTIFKTATALFAIKSCFSIFA